MKGLCQKMACISKIKKLLLKIKKLYIYKIFLIKLINP